MKMIRYLVLPVISLTISYASAQQGEWTWMKGDSTDYPLPEFGQMGVSSLSNVPPGLLEPIGWTDLNGNFWMFGGWRDFGDMYNTLWKYDPSANEWTWVKGDNLCCSITVYGTLGIPDIDNTPGARRSGCSWTDHDGNLWLYGGIGIDDIGVEHVMNDLWMYDITTNTWTWMAGDEGGTHDVQYGVLGIPDFNNDPGSRVAAGGFVDTDNNLWLFGGLVYDSADAYSWVLAGCGNDLWKFDRDSMWWTWMSGTNVMDEGGTYGTQGVPSPNNIPSGRGSYAYWTDAASDFWLFGGSTTLPGNAWSDLWRYDPDKNEWTWISGSDQPNQNHSATEICEPNKLNIPSNRYQTYFWIDSSNNIWLFGGLRNTFPDFQNDLWHYNTNTNEWTWINGQIEPNGAGQYGIQGISFTTNQPPSKSDGISWRDSNNNLWMFGGRGENFSVRNDLWRYVINPECPPSSIGTVVVTTSNNHVVNVNPNPSDGNFILSTEVIMDENITVTIYSVTGNMIYESVFRINQDYLNLPLHLKNISEGIYMIRIKSGSNYFAGKLIVQS